MWTELTPSDGLRVVLRDALLHLAHGQTHREYVEASRPQVRLTGDPVRFLVEAALVPQYLPAPRRWIRALHELFPESQEAAREAAALPGDDSARPTTDADREVVRELVDWVATKLVSRTGQPFDVRQYFDVYDALVPAAPEYVLAEEPSDVEPEGCFGYTPHPLRLVAHQPATGETHHFLRAVKLPRSSAAAFQWFTILHLMNRHYTMELPVLSEKLVFDSDSIEGIIQAVASQGGAEEDGGPPYEEKLRALELAPQAWMQKDGIYATFVVFSQYKGALRRTCRITPDAMQQADEVIVPYNCGIVY